MTHVNWQQPEPFMASTDFLEGCPDILREIVWRRGYRTDAQAEMLLHPATFQIPDLASYTALQAAAARVSQALDRHEPIAVWGDFDVDGQTATALLVGSLRRMGATVSFHIPDRIAETHGLNEAGLLRLIQAGYRLLITCDCGTNDVDAVAFAGSLGLDVVITDHHQQLGPLPDAHAICNSSHLPLDHPLHGVPGVGMAYLLARSLFRQQGKAIEANYELDLVALGIIADVALHTPANRALLVHGLRRFWREPRPGLWALVKRIGTPALVYDTEWLAFHLVPMLNAAGRMADAALGVSLLLATDNAEAVRLAEVLSALNDERRRQGARLDLELALLAGTFPEEHPALVLDGPGWHVGLIGLAASRLARRYAIPAVVIAHGLEGEPARGSVRGTGQHDVLGALASQSHLLLSFGGHHNAAGLSIEQDHIEAFREGFSRSIAEQGSTASASSLAVDAIVPWHGIATDDLGPGSLYEIISRLAPFGPGNPLPVLASLALHLVSLRPFGTQREHAWLELADAQGHRHVLQWWRYEPRLLPEGPLDVAYTLSRHEWQNTVSVRLTLEAIRPHLDQCKEI